MSKSSLIGIDPLIYQQLVNLRMDLDTLYRDSVFLADTLGDNPADSDHDARDYEALGVAHDTDCLKAAEELCMDTNARVIDITHILARLKAEREAEAAPTTPTARRSERPGGAVVDSYGSGDGIVRRSERKRGALRSQRTPG